MSVRECEVGGEPGGQKCGVGWKCNKHDRFLSCTACFLSCRRVWRYDVDDHAGQAHPGVSARHHRVGRTGPAVLPGKGPAQLTCCAVQHIAQHSTAHGALCSPTPQDLPFRAAAGNAAPVLRRISRHKDGARLPGLWNHGSVCGACRSRLAARPVHLTAAQGAFPRSFPPHGRQHHAAAAAAIHHVVAYRLCNVQTRPCMAVCPSSHRILPPSTWVAT